MTVRAPRRKKPTIVNEVLRTLTAYDLLIDGWKQRIINCPAFGDGALTAKLALLAIAERIAARTEDEE